MVSSLSPRQMSVNIVEQAHAALTATSDAWGGWIAAGGPRGGSLVIGGLDFKIASEGEGITRAGALPKGTTRKWVLFSLPQAGRSLMHLLPVHMTWHFCSVWRGASCVDLGLHLLVRCREVL